MLLEDDEKIAVVAVLLNEWSRLGEEQNQRGQRSILIHLFTLTFQSLDALYPSHKSICAS